MSEEERSLTGLRNRAWVIGQAKKVYQDSKRDEAALMLQEYLEDGVTPEQDEVHVDCSIASSLNAAEHQHKALDNQGLECKPHSFGAMHEGFMTSNGLNLGFQNEIAIAGSQFTSDTQRGMGTNNSNQLFNFSEIVQNRQDLITYLHQ